MFLLSIGIGPFTDNAIPGLASFVRRPVLGPMRELPTRPISRRLSTSSSSHNIREQQRPRNLGAQACQLPSELIVPLFSPREVAVNPLEDIFRTDLSTRLPVRVRMPWLLCPISFPSPRDRSNFYLRSPGDSYPLAVCIHEWATQDHTIADYFLNRYLALPRQRITIIAGSTGPSFVAACPVHRDREAMRVWLAIVDPVYIPNCTSLTCPASW